jgi:RNA polymerase sigma-70 factor (ECF subfamily)
VADDHARSDQALLEAIRAGDDAALGLLLERYAPSVKRFGLKMCRDPEDASDVLQETLLAAARGMKDYRGASSLATWLYSIARSFCIKKRRGARAEMVPWDDDHVLDVAACSPAPDEAAEQKEIGSALEEAIAALAPAFREVLILRDVEGLTAPEVAEVLGIGVDAVKSRLHRARIAVRDRIAPLVNPGDQSKRAGCPDVVPLLSRYLEGEIGMEQCAEMEAHVSDCERCRADCDSLRRVLDLCKNATPSGEIPGDVQREVQRAIAAIARV